ncbi:hypothetical protein ACRQ1B_23530 [Rhizobium panacihumi]|uniref:hypothetical protein n=1 Tax=Rhizobium panacihumi TaxID=2008450 RepID=UPI003D7C0D38
MGTTDRLAYPSRITRPPASTIAASVTLFFLIIMQVTPLFWGASFAIDWTNHVWIIGYYTQYLAQNGWFPNTMDIIQNFGEPMPIFYGVFFYPIMSLIALLTGAEYAVRFTAAALFILPAVAYCLFFARLTQNLTAAVLLSLLVNASVYQLTNIYTRSAITEFFACQFLLLAIPFIAYGCISRTKLGVSALVFGFCLATLSLGSHPITFYTFTLFSIPLLVVLFPALAKVIDRKQILYAGALTAIVITVLLPWVVATLKYKDDLTINTIMKSSGILIYFPYSIDSFRGRLGLFYTDPRVIAQGLQNVSTPFLDAPFPIVSAIAACYLAYKLHVSRKKYAIYYITALLIILVLFILCVVPPDIPYDIERPDELRVTALDSPVAKIMHPIQFIYRLAGTFTLIIAMLLVCGVALRAKDESRPSYNIRFLAVCTAISMLCIMQKCATTYDQYVGYPHINMTMEDQVARQADYLTQTSNFEQYPATFYGAGAYSMPLINTMADDAALKDRDRIYFNFTEWNAPQTVRCDKSCALITNIASSKFTKVVLRGQAQAKVMTLYNGNLVFIAEPGLHSVEIQHQGRMLLFIQVSIALVIVWLFVSTTWLAGCLTQRVKRVRA